MSSLVILCANFNSFRSSRSKKGTETESSDEDSDEDFGMLAVDHFRLLDKLLSRHRMHYVPRILVSDLLLLLLLFTRPLPRDGGMAEDHGAPEAGQFPRVWTRGHKETESRQRVRSWTVQNEMRDVLGRVSTGAARILDSANPGEIKI